MFVKHKVNFESKCDKCGVELGKEHPHQNGMCIGCFADDWEELVEISPMASPRGNTKMKDGVKIRIQEEIEEIRKRTEDIFYLIPIDEEGGREMRKYIDNLTDEMLNKFYKKMKIEL